MQNGKARSENFQEGSDRYGFVCPGCSFRLLLSQDYVAEKIGESFKSGSDTITMTCPECERESFYNRWDLILFLPGGRQVAVNKQSLSTP